MKKPTDTEFVQENQQTSLGAETTDYEICDYSDTDYAAFWEGSDREYEDAVERIALRHLIKGMSGSCLEIGCGFGRLVNEYAHLCTSVTLTDYAENMIDQAKARVRKLGLAHVECMKADLYELDSYGRKYNNAVCVRVMHHVESVPAFFEQVNCVLEDDGVFIFEYANKKNFVEIVRYLLKRPNVEPFEYYPSRRGKSVYYNFHPEYVKDMLDQCGFAIEEELAVSMFRNKILKKLFGYKALSSMERLLQKPLSCLHLAPSVFVKARKVRTIDSGPSLIVTSRKAKSTRCKSRDSDE